MVSAPCRARDFELERYTGVSLGAGKATLAGLKFSFLPPPPPPPPPFFFFTPNKKKK